MTTRVKTLTPKKQERNANIDPGFFPPGPFYLNLPKKIIKLEPERHTTN